LLRLIKDPKKTDDDRVVCFEILNRLSRYTQVHERLIAEGVVELLSSGLDDFLRLDTAQLKSDQMGLLARSFYVITNFCKNKATVAQLNTSGLVPKFLQINERFKDSDYLNELFIRSLYEILSSYEGVLVLQAYKIDLRSLVLNSIASQNRRVLEQTESIVIRLMKPDDLKDTLAKVRAGETTFENLAYLAFLAQNEMMTDLLEDPTLIDMALNILTTKDLKPQQQFAVIKFIRALVLLSEKMAQHFVSINGVQLILEKIGVASNFIVWAEFAGLLDTLISNLPREDLDKDVSDAPFKQLIRFFEQLNATLDTFQKNALTIEKAQDSLEFHKNEVSRAILMEMKPVKPEELVNRELALDYISAEHFAVSIFRLFQRANDLGSPKLGISEEFITTCSVLLRVFKSSKALHERMFGMLAGVAYDKKLAEFIGRLNWAFPLNDVVWKKPNWKLFAYNVLRFLDAVVRVNPGDKSFRGNLNVIRLIASIKNFVIEEDYKDFEEAGEAKESEASDVLTFAQEREIHKKGSELVALLADSATPVTFKGSVDKSIKLFKPKPETIQILRAEYAVLTCLNGDNFFGNDGLKMHMQTVLAQNIVEIEKAVQNKPFVDKEKLIPDCIRAIANFVCITWNESGKNAYERANISAIVFGLFDQYLKGSESPLASYILLKAFREWLINRIEIIENASNMERDKIYDPESFMMVPLAQKEGIITSVMDSLYMTHQRFNSNEKVVKLNFEVIILLGYVYPAWKSKVAKNFIPQALDSLMQNDLSMESDLQALELLKQLTGTDEKSEGVLTEALEIAVKNGGLPKLCKSIADNNFDKRYIIAAKPLMEAFGEYEVKMNAKDTQSVVQAALDRIEAFNKLPADQKMDPARLAEIAKTLDDLNSYALIDHLEKYMLAHKHPELIGDLWNFVNSAPKTGGAADSLMSKIDKGCALGIVSHLNDSANKQEAMKQMFGNPKTFKFATESPNILINAFRSLQKNSSDPDVVLNNAKIINDCFPSANSLTCQKIAKEIKFQPTLEYIFNSFGPSESRDLAQEANSLYFNLTEKQDEKTVEKMIKKIMRKFKQDITAGAIVEIESSFLTLSPFTKNPVFINNQEEFCTDDYILKTLMLLHAKIKEKLDKNTFKLLNEAIGDSNVPDIGDGNKKIIAEEIALAKTLTEYILDLPEALQKKTAGRADILRLTDVELILAGNQRAYDLVDMYLKDEQARQIMAGNRGFEINSYILLKNTKDAFKPAEYTSNEPVGVSAVLKSGLGASGLTKSLLRGPKGPQTNVSFVANEDSQQSKVLDEAKSEAIEKLIERYSQLSLPLLNKPKIGNIIELYIKEMGSFKPGDQKQLTECIAIGRLMACLLSMKEADVDLKPYSEDLQKAMIKFLDAAAAEPNMNKKLMRFFENNLAKMAKRLDRTPNSMRNPDLWNKLVDRYFLVAPESIRPNHKKVFQALDFTKPHPKPNALRRKMFEEKTGQLRFQTDYSGADPLSKHNKENAKAILDNFHQTIESVNVDQGLALKTLEGLTRSKEVASALVGHPLCEVLLMLVASYADYEDLDKFNGLADSLMNTLTLASRDPELRATLNSKVHPDNLLKVFIDNVDAVRRPLINKSLEALGVIFTAVDNNTAFFDKRIPEKVLDIIGPGDDWTDENNPAILLLALMMKDHSLEKIAAGVDILDHTLQALGKDVLPNPPTVPNPGDLFNKQLTEVSPVPAVQKAQLASYLLGELSKYDTNATKMAQNDGKTLVFDLYDAYERLDNDPVVATKIIEACRNAVYGLEDQTVDEHPKEVEKLCARIPAKIQKYRALILVPRYLQEILDFFKSKKKAPQEDKPMPFKKMNRPNVVVASQTFQADDEESWDRQSLSAKQSAAKASLPQRVELASRMSLTKKMSLIEQSQVTPSDAFKSNDVGEIYRYIADQLEKGPLTCEDTKMYEIANQKLGEVLANPNDTTVYPMVNLQVPNSLRLIANSINSTNIQKLDALKLLNGFLQKKDLVPKFIENEFFVQKSAELINQFANLTPDISGLKQAERNPLFEDLKFMKRLTDEPEGAEIALEVDQGTPIIKTMIHILQSDSSDEELKLKAVEILNNLLKVRKDAPLEMQLLKGLPEMVKKNLNSLALTTALTEMTATILKDSPENKAYFTDNKLLDLPKKAIEHFQNKSPLNNAVAALLRHLATDFPASHEQILESPLMPYMARQFNNPNSDKALHQDVAKMLLEVGYGSPEKKKRLVQHGFTAGLVTLLNMYSSPEMYDPEMCETVLKLIANFSTIPEGIEILLKDGAIPAFRRFFDRYKETLPVHNKIMMATISNMAYEHRPEVTDKIIADKGLELIVDALKFYTDKRDLETTEVAIDALSHIAANPQAVKYLEGTNVVDALINLVRGQLSDKLTYAALGCLTSFAVHDVFADKIVQKGGPDAAADIYKAYHDDPKNLLQATKLLNLLTLKKPDQANEFIKAGVPGKIIANFDEKWP
jgi:hypothetical protein